jgi:SH3 domain protein
MLKIHQVPVLALVLLVLGAGTGWAAKAFTTDAQEVGLRAAPNPNAKQVVAIPPGSAVEVVQGNQWSRVQYTPPGGGPHEGWVQSRFLAGRPPESNALKALTAENAALREQISLLDKEKAGFQQREKELSDKLVKLSSAYEELKGGSANYLKLKGEYDSVKQGLASAQESIQTLLQKNEGLELSNRIQWFLAGATVLLFGLAVGWATGRHQKKRRSLYR